MTRPIPIIQLLQCLKTGDGRRSRIFSLAVILVVTLAQGCASRPNEAPASCSATGERFFPLCDYINGKMVEYTEAGYTVDKLVTLNANTESIRDLEVNWAVELQPLATAYINRSAWLDKFEVDTATTDSGYAVTYSSHSATIPVKELEVRFTGAAEGRVVESIRIKTARKNILYTSNQEIEFAPEQYYSVKGKQRTMFLSKTEFGVRSEINIPGGAGTEPGQAE